eukprot:scaffold9951_cov146-Cylindrotheca_fusiformis.AAC.9
MSLPIMWSIVDAARSHRCFCYWICILLISNLRALMPLVGVGNQQEGIELLSRKLRALSATQSAI